MHRNSLLLFQQIGRPLLKGRFRILEIGPGVFPSHLQLACDWPTEWHTLDIVPQPELTYYADQYEFPVPDTAYDAVVAANVVEHVRKPWRWIREVARVMRPGAVVVLVSPVDWAFHEDPVDCWRIYPDGFRALFDEAGLTFNLGWHGSREPLPVHLDAIAIGTKPL